MDHDEGISAKGNDRFENLPRVGHRLVQGSCADCNYLDELLLGIEKNDPQRFLSEKMHFRTKVSNG